MLRKLSLGAAAALSPATAIAEAEGVQTDIWGVALNGLDATSYFDADTPSAGAMRFEVQWRGATWRFHSAEAMAAFLADPERYTPAFGGRCAWSQASGVSMPGDPHEYAIIDGQLLLFAGPAEREAYLAGVRTVAD